MRDASMLHELEERHKRLGNSDRKLLYHLERDLQAAREAMRWLTRPSADLTEVRELAGFEVSSRIGFYRTQIIKYMWRLCDKGSPLKDAKKAQFYLDRLIQKLS